MAHDRRAARLFAIALPVALPAAMAAVFRIGRRRLGDRGGYVGGFVVYWSACAAVAGVVLGRRGVVDAIARGGARRPTPIEWALLAWSPAGAVTTRLLPDLPHARRAEVATSVTIAEVNAVLEELLWRGVYVTLWPDDPLLGWVWPSLGFGAWHLAPQVIHPSSMGPARYAAASTALGLTWGWVAWRTGSLRWTVLSHVIADASGIRNARFFLGN